MHAKKCKAVRKNVKRKGIAWKHVERFEGWGGGYTMGYTLGYALGTPPVKMDCFQNKGVAGKAFCKCLNRKRMDDGRFCYS